MIKNQIIALRFAFFDLTIILLHPPEMQLGVAIYRHDKSPFLKGGFRGNVNIYIF